jgi:hypothetical protein
MVFETLLNFLTLLPFLSCDLLVSRFKLFVLIVVLSGKDFEPLLDEVSLLSAVNQNIDLLIEVHLF